MTERLQNVAECYVGVTKIMVPYLWRGLIS